MGHTLERAREVNVPVHLLPAWYGVDHEGVVHMLPAELFEGRSFHAGCAPHTRGPFANVPACTHLGDRLAVAPLTCAAQTKADAAVVTPATFVEGPP